MRILVGWDDPQQSELISLYLGIGDHATSVEFEGGDLLARLSTDEKWDVLFLSITLPDVDGGFETFQQVRRLRSNLPIVGACSTQDVYRIVRFMSHGMTAYAIRDDRGDYIFMLLAVLESAVESVTALREHQMGEKLREEVQSIQRLQKLMIPAQFDPPDGYKIVARYDPSRIRVAGGKVITMAGGDYYDVFTLDRNHIVLLVGDASGHGMRAAMSIMVMHTLVRLIRKLGCRDTAAFVQEINKQLCQHSVVNEQGGFITLCYGVLQLDTNELQWTSAGHPIPLVQDLTTGHVRAIGDTTNVGSALALNPTARYDAFVVPLPEKYRLLFYTDGLQKAFPVHHSSTNGDATRHGEFGVNGITDTLESRRHATLTEAMQALFAESDAYTQGSGRHDDTSVVLLERFQ